MLRYTHIGCIVEWNFRSDRLTAFLRNFAALLNKSLSCAVRDAQSVVCRPLVPLEMCGVLFSGKTRPLQWGTTCTTSKGNTRWGFWGETWCCRQCEGRRLLRLEEIMRLTGCRSSYTGTVPTAVHKHLRILYNNINR